MITKSFKIDADGEIVEIKLTGRLVNDAGHVFFILQATSYECEPENVSHVEYMIDANIEIWKDAICDAMIDSDVEDAAKVFAEYDDHMVEG